MSASRPKRARGARAEQPARPAFRILRLPTFKDRRGRLTYVEAMRHLPFRIRRTYYLYQVPAKAARAGHFHRKLRQALIAVAGSFSVRLSGRFGSRVIRLDRPDRALLIEPPTWLELSRFSDSAVCLVLASRAYEPSDCHRQRPQDPPRPRR